MHVAVRLIAPHGPWIMVMVTISQASGCVVMLGSSVDTIVSIASSVRIFDSSSRMTSMWTWGSPRF